MTNESLFPELEKPSMNFNNLGTSKLPTLFNAEKKSFYSYFSKTIEKPKANVWLFFGDTASGKTFTSLSFPAPIYVIDTENRAIATKYYNYKEKEIHIFEPVQLRTEFDSINNDAFDTYKTIEEINKFIIQFANEVKKGNIKQGTLVIDSVTDIWSFVQDWASTEMSKKLTSKGNKRADSLTGEYNVQFDWKVPNKKHYEMLGILRSLIKYGINIVFTARERETPDYVKEKPQSTKDIIRAQKDVPFLADIIIHLRKTIGINQTKFWGTIIKLSGLTPPNDMTENVTFEKINKLMEEK